MGEEHSAGGSARRSQGSGLSLIPICAFRHHQARPDPFLMQGLGLLEKLSDVQRHAVSDDIDGVVVKHAARKLVQGEFPILIDDGVAGVAAALKADDYIRLGGEDVGDFSLPLITPEMCIRDRSIPNLKQN